MKQEAFTKKKLLHFLSWLGESPEYYLTIYITPASFPWCASDMAFEQSPFTEEVGEALNDEVVLQEARRWGNGAVVFWSEGGKGYVVLPPFPLTEDRVFRGKVATSLLQQLLEKERSLGVVLVTWGSYAVGIIKGDELVEYKTGTGYIHKRHRKGGRSEKRFARRTEEQKKDFLRRVANRIEESFTNYRLEQIFFGGNRLLLKPLLEECSYLESEIRQISRRVLNVRYATRQALLGSAEEINKSLVFEREVCAR